MSLEVPSNRKSDLRITGLADNPVFIHVKISSWTFVERHKTRDGPTRDDRKRLCSQEHREGEHQTLHEETEGQATG